MSKLKKLLVLSVIVLLVIGICVQVRANETPIDLGNFLNSNTTNTANPANTMKPANTTNPANTTGGAIVQPTTNTSNSVADNNLPQTGVTDDITVAFFIVICVIAAIYAYKKIRDYKS